MHVQDSPGRQPRRLLKDLPSAGEVCVVFTVQKHHPRDDLVVMLRSVRLLQG